MATKEQRYPIEYKIEVCEYAKKENIKSAAIAYGIPRNSVGRWLNLYVKSGIKGLIVTRNDTQDTKLDKNTINKIKNYIRSNPECKLLEIKNKFNLNCSISLISKKLNAKNNGIHCSNKYKIKKPDQDQIKNETPIEKAIDMFSAYNYQAALVLFRDILHQTKTCPDLILAAEASYYIGRINNIFHDNKMALKYFRKSVSILKDRGDALSQSLYYRAKYSIAIIETDFEKAELFSEFYRKSAFETTDVKIIGKCISTSCSYLYSTGKYDIYLNEMQRAAVYNRANGNKIELCGNLINILNVYACVLLQDSNEVENIYEEINKCSQELKKPALLYEADYRLGVRYYMRNEVDKSEKQLLKSLACSGKYCDKETYLSNILYLGNLLFFKKKDIRGGIRKLNLLYKESVKFGNDLYLMHATKLLAEIFMRLADSKKAVRFIKKTIVLSEKLKDLYTAGKFFYFYGCFCKSSGRIKMAEWNLKRSIESYEKFSELSTRSITNEISAVKVELKNLYCDYNNRYETLGTINKLNKCKAISTAFFIYHNLLNYVKKINGEGYEKICDVGCSANDNSSVCASQS